VGGYDLFRKKDRGCTHLAELVLNLSDPGFTTSSEGHGKVTATASLVFHPADVNEREIESRRFRFTSPIGLAEFEELRWYLECSHFWPAGVFKERAKRLEYRLPEWGRKLYAAALSSEGATSPLGAWCEVSDDTERRLSVVVDADPPEETEGDHQIAASQAASILLALPWELLHDEHSYLFRQAHGVRIRRRLPNRTVLKGPVRQLPIRVLLVSPRPEDDTVGYIDHRVSALPLVESMEALGELVNVTVLTPPTFPALCSELQHAREEGRPFDLVHFDGHGWFDQHQSVGKLCFEDPSDLGKSEYRSMQAISAPRLAGILRDHRIPLVFLEACQSGQIEMEPTASVAVSLLQEGVTSVIAMSHSVLVETSRRFVTTFYRELANGQRVGTAMLAGQRELANDKARGFVMGAGRVELEDWFVPVLYQERNDPQLFSTLLPSASRQIEERRKKLRLGALPTEPNHGFVGRSRELLRIERLHANRSWVAVRGMGGCGKTALAAEYARWMVRSGRFRRAAFVCLERIHDARGVLDTIGRQILPGNWSVAQFQTITDALLPVENALRGETTIIVIDNLESVLPEPGIDNEAIATEHWRTFVELFDRLLEAASTTRVVFTTRETLHKPFVTDGCEIELKGLSHADAVSLVSRVMAAEGLAADPSDPGSTPEGIDALIETVGCHARALVLLAPEVARRGILATTDEIAKIARDLEQRYPNNRELSLFASTELSLRRMPEAIREKVGVLGVFRCGAHQIALAEMPGFEKHHIIDMRPELVRVGLAEDMGDLYMKLDPGLLPYLLGQLPAEERHEAEACWLRGTEKFAGFLNLMFFRDSGLVAKLTQLDLPNLLAALENPAMTESPKRLVTFVSRVERVVAGLGFPRPLSRFVQARRAAAITIDEWCHEVFEHEYLEAERLLFNGNVRAAMEKATKLADKCLAQDAPTYDGADFDGASLQWLLGRVFLENSEAQRAMEPLKTAQRAWLTMAKTGHEGAKQMAAFATGDIAGCLESMGLLNDAEAAYKSSITILEGLGDRRHVAVAKANLGILRMQQRRYADALKSHFAAKEIFEELAEPSSVATSWHNIGLVFGKVGRFEDAENAYQEALAIEVQNGNKKGEATALLNLGNLYSMLGRNHDAASFRGCPRFR
jgi:tetratricopeptide (TPR) repeat protein